MWVTSLPKHIAFDYSIQNTVVGKHPPPTKYQGVTIQSNIKWNVHSKQVAAETTNTQKHAKKLHGYHV